MLPKKLPAKIVYQIVRTKLLCEKAFEKLSPKMVVLKRCPKCLREDSRSKCPYRTASWKIFRGSYHQKRQFWKAAQNFIRKNSGVAQNVRSGILAEKASEKTTIENDRSEMLPKNISAKTVVQNVRTEMLAEKASEKATIKNDSSESLPKTLSAKQWFKMTVSKY